MVIESGLIAKAGEGFIKEAYGALKSAGKKKWQSFNWYTAQGWYLQKIEKDYGTTRILGKHEPISLEGIFTDIYILDKPTAFRRFDIVQLKNNQAELHDHKNRISGLELIKKKESHRLYILGKPGAGKTTFLKYVALIAARNEIKKIPIFISLYDWAKSEMELLPFIVKQFEICSFPDSQPLVEYILEHGLAIVLFDGLDETKQEGGKRNKIIEEIREFSRKYDSTQILITCRIAATDYTFEEFTYVEVADFTKQQIETYVNKWFSYDLDKQLNFEAEFNRAENERLREMANTPLLLSLLCLTFEVTGTFPNRRVEIYEEGINALLSKWDSSRNIIRDEIYKGLSLGRKRQMFARIAAQTFEKNEYFIRKHKLINLITDYLSLLPDAPAKEDIDGAAVLTAIEAQHSIFVERAKNIYSFSHLTFQEYFTSKYTIENAAKGTIRELLSVKNIIDFRWREVILNTASLLDEADDFFNIMKESVNYLLNEQMNKFLQWVTIKADKINQNNLNTRANYVLYHISHKKFSDKRTAVFLNNDSKDISDIGSETIKENTYDVLAQARLILRILISSSSGAQLGVDIQSLHKFFSGKIIAELSIDFQILSLHLMLNFISTESSDRITKTYPEFLSMFQNFLNNIKKGSCLAENDIFSDFQ